MTETLPRPIQDGTYKSWQFEILRALGYREYSPSGRVKKHFGNLPMDCIAFAENSDGVIVWEVDGYEDEHGIRKARIEPDLSTIALRPIRYPMPAGFELVDVTTPDGAVHRIALRKATS
jgi:hypothetical protein